MRQPMMMQQQPGGPAGQPPRMRMISTQPSLPTTQQNLAAQSTGLTFNVPTATDEHGNLTFDIQ